MRLRARYLGLVAAVVIAMLAPGTARAAGYQVSRYDGLSPAQRASLLAIARDTWKFYGADVDQATSLPMDNITFAGGSATPTSEGRYTSAANIGVYLWAVVSARDLGLISEPQARARIEATLTEVRHLQRYDGFLYQWYDTANGDVLSNPGAGDCAETHPGVRQLLLRLQRGQRLVRLGPDRGPAGPAGAGRPGGQPARADELRALLRQPGRDALQHQPGDHREPADRPDVRRVLRRAAAGSGQQLDALLPQRRAVQRPADLRLHRHGPAPDAGQRVVAQLAGTAAAGPVRRLPGHRPRLLLAGAVAHGRLLADLHRPAVRPAIPASGKGTTPTRAPT